MILLQSAGGDGQVPGGVATDEREGEETGATGHHRNRGICRIDEKELTSLYVRRGGPITVGFWIKCTIECENVSMSVYL